MSHSTDQVRHVAIAGNPNCGKTTIFNALTGLRQKTGNYAGVTVELKIGRFHGAHGEPMDLLDIPGSYSLQVRSPDEAVARDVLFGRRADTAAPQIIIAAVDASNLERNLYLVAQLLELGKPIIIALNMVDVAEAAGIRIDTAALSRNIGAPVIPMVANEGKGLVELKQTLSRTPLPDPAPRPVLPVELEKAAADFAPRLGNGPTAFSEAVLLLCTADADTLAQIQPDPALREETLARQKQLTADGCDIASAAIDARYAWVQRVCEGAVIRQDSPALSASDRFDQIATHPVYGWMLFISAMLLVFLCIFFVAAYPMDWIDAGFGALGDWIGGKMPEGDLRGLVVDGIIGGVGGVVIFLPQILILYFFLGLLEDSGYMARAAFIMDRVMSRVGLHGKSFIPLLSSYACAIPGVMAARTIESRKDRLVTILIAPLMSCSARLPVYTVLIGLLPLSAASAIGENTARALVMLAMYAVGTIGAFLMAWVFKKTLLKSETPMLLLELPPYRRPAVRNILVRMWDRAFIFLRRAGTIILALSIVLWALLTYPKPQNPEATPADAIAASYGGQMGKAIEPLISPLGYDWKIGIALVSSFAAREVFVGTMGMIHNIEDADESNEELHDILAKETHPDGRRVFTPLVCIGLMIFYVFAMQCLSTVAVVRRETNSWGWAGFQFAYMAALAWLGAFVVYQGGRLLGWH